MNSALVQAFAAMARENAKGKHSFVMFGPVPGASGLAPVLLYSYGTFALGKARDFDGELKMFVAGDRRPYFFTEREAAFRAWGAACAAVCKTLMQMDAAFVIDEGVNVAEEQYQAVRDRLASRAVDGG